MRRQPLPRLVALALAAWLLSGNDTGRFAGLLLLIVLLGLLVWLRQAVTPRCTSCGSRTCSHVFDGIKGHPVLGALYGWHRHPNVLRAARGREETLLLAIIRGRIRGEPLRAGFRDLAGRLPGVAVALIDTQPRLRRELGPEEIAVLLVHAGAAERAHVISLLAELRGGPTPFAFRVAPA